LNMEYIHIKTKLVKNGKQIHRLTYEINILKPKCWVEGFEYKFNSRIVSREVFQNEDEYLDATREHICS